MMMCMCACCAANVQIGGSSSGVNSVYYQDGVCTIPVGSHCYNNHICLIGVIVTLASRARCVLGKVSLTRQACSVTISVPHNLSDIEKSKHTGLSFGVTVHVHQR